jgi:cystathionine beta-lyase
LVVTATQELGDQVKFIQNASGAILSPHDSWLVIRGIETLHLRIAQHSASAQKIAEYLVHHPFVDKVYYPGLKDHPNHHIAALQQRGFGGVVSFTLKTDTEEAATAVVCSTTLFKLAESLGGVKSLLCHPASMTHKSIPADRRRSAGVSDSLVRLSVGLEETIDLLGDIARALDVAHHSVTQQRRQSAVPA